MVNGLLAGAAGGATVAIVIKAVDQFSGVFAKANKSMLATGAAITAVGIAGASVIGGVIKMAAAYETAHVTFETMLGSAEKATEVLKDLSDFAAKTPFNIPGVRQAATQLIAYGFEVEGLIDNMRMLGDIAGIFNIPMQDMSYLYGTLRAQGRAYTRDMNQFANRGIPIWKEVAKVMGVTESEVRDLVESGKVGFPEIEQAMINMTSEGGIAFEGMEKKAATLEGVISNIQDSFRILGEIMGQTFLPAAKWVAEAFANIMAWAEEHPKLAKWGAAALGIATALALIVGPLTIIIALFPSLIAGLTAINLLLSPITIAIIGIGIALVGLGLIIYDIATHFDEFKVAMAMTWNKIVKIYENGINKIIDGLNWMIRAWNRIAPGFMEFGEIGHISFEGIDIDRMVWEINTRKKLTEGIENQTKATKALAEQDKRITDLQGHMLTAQGDIFDPNKALFRSDFKSRESFEQAIMLRNNGGSTQFNTVNIENVNGLDPDEVAIALERALENKIAK